MPLPLPRTLVAKVALPGLLSLAFPQAAPAQEPPVSRGDSARMVKEARDRQRDFEMFRQSRIPVEPEGRAQGCDQNIGRICIWFGGDEEADFPAESVQVGMARRELLQLLGATATRIADPWVAGQLVRYLAEGGELAGAEAAARRCAPAGSWWCAALLGYALHLQGDFPGAEAAFRDAAATLPKEERERWLTPRYILTRDGARELERGEAQERARRWDLFWALSDPLFLVEGNDRLTDHFARWVEATMQRDVENAQGLFWEEDLEEVLVRYGRIVGYSRTHNPGAAMGGGGRFRLQDTRRVVGHHAPRSRGYLFPEAFLRSPSEIPAESWLTPPREARTWYAPPYAPDLEGLETQVGRFRRGDEMLVVGAYRPAPPDPGMGPGSPGVPLAAGDPVEAGLFLVPVDGGETMAVRGTDGEGTFTLRAPTGRYVSSLEVLDTSRRRAWRARQGVRQVPLVPGLVALSDVLLLRPGAPLPASLDEAIPLVRPGIRLARGERFTVVWEVYGLRVDQTAQVTLGFTRGRPGFLERVGDFLGVLEPDRPVEVTFEDPGSDQVQSAFRSMTLELPDLEPGAYTLHLRLALPGREPALVSRPIVVEE